MKTDVKQPISFTNLANGERTGFGAVEDGQKLPQVVAVLLENGIKSLIYRKLNSSK